jgi:hypothetical protein
MTAVKKNTAWKLSRDTDTRPLTRRRFFASMLPAIASAMAWPLVLDYFQGERRFFAQAAELSGETITVDLHCHPNLSGGGKLPEFDPEVPDNMRTGAWMLVSLLSEVTSAPSAETPPGYTQNTKT